MSVSVRSSGRFLPLRCEILLFADLHEFWSQPVSLEGQGALGRLYRVWNDKSNWQKLCKASLNYVWFKQAWGTLPSILFNWSICPLNVRVNMITLKSLLLIRKRLQWKQQCLNASKLNKMFFFLHQHNLFFGRMHFTLGTNCTKECGL